MSERDIDDDISRLVRLAGPRTAVPDGVSSRVHAAVQTQWRQTVVARRRRRMFVAAAAALAALAGMTMVERTIRSRAADPLPVTARTTTSAILERVTGGGLWSAADGPLQALAPGADVAPNTWLETRETGRAALRIPGASIRFDTNTRAQIVSTSVILLDRGALYVDTGTTDRAPLEIRTAHGVVTHLGTQFEVQATPDATRVRVREGKIVLVRATDRREAIAGTELAVGVEGRLVRRDVAVFGAEWNWVEQAAPEFTIEGQTLEALLHWTARETGWTIRFASSDTARSVAGIRLHGSSAGLTPSETLEAVLPTCNLSLRLEGGIAWIEPPRRRSEGK
jgi:hypothetical protein